MERRRDITEDDAPLQFDGLLAQASATFIRATAHEIDHRIDEWLERFSTVLGIHKAVLVQIDPTDGKLEATHQWVEGSVLPSPLATAAQDYPWVTSKMRSGELVVLNNTTLSKLEFTGAI